MEKSGGGFQDAVVNRIIDVIYEETEKFWGKNYATSNAAMVSLSKILKTMGATGEIIAEEMGIEWVGDEEEEALFKTPVV